MKIQFWFLQITVTTLIFFSTGYGQYSEDELDKCGFDDQLARSYLKILGDHWGYSYDSLLIDLDKWVASPYINIDSLGASVQNRAIWQLTVSANDITKASRHTVFFHTRTHPGEVQSFRVVEQVINILTSESDFARLLRENFVFYIIPMYNPDGVELEYPRENANGVDLESNWDKNPTEPEVAVLKKRFSELMASEAPIEVAMNMHSAYGTNRYFVYHDAIGTSTAYTILEQNYINSVRNEFITGIRPWDFFVSWTSGTPTHYPESWFWLNFQEAVMALTYEDWNSSMATDFDSTANALLHGIADYVGVRTAIASADLPVPGKFELLQNYPNPFNPSTRIRFHLYQAATIELTVFNSRGRRVAELWNGPASGGPHQVELRARDLASGIYFYQLKSANFLQTRKMVLVR